MASSSGGLEPSAHGDRLPHRNTTRRSAQIAGPLRTPHSRGGRAPDLTVPLTQGEAKKGGRHVATAALSLGRKRPRRAYAAGHAAPQQYRHAPHQMQEIFWLPPFRCARIGPVRRLFSAQKRKRSQLRSGIVIQKQGFMKTVGIITRRPLLQTGMARMHFSQDNCALWGLRA